MTLTQSNTQASLASLPADYDQRVYAGLLGKVIGVYVGRPVEGWLYQRIQDELGDIDYFVHDRVGVPLTVVDDDISGTLAFMAAISDNGNDFGVTPQQIGDAWLNYAVEERTIFWWGGMGNSTEHTAYLHMKRGLSAPLSGSIDKNGAQVAEQIGAQIFIDGWAMLVPNQPALAADIARRAATVSHDGEAVFAAQVMAAMESAAFAESDIDRLIEHGLSVIPEDSVIAQLILDLCEWHRVEPDWRVARERLEAKYGYDKFGGNVHVVPNHGVILLALLYGDGDWDRSMMIVNTCGWDTDCNSGNLGCLLGIRNGLSAFAGPFDWRGPVADRLFLPSADGARTATDVATEALQIANMARAIRGEERQLPKDGARFSFPFPGAVQGFEVRSGTGSLEVIEGVGEEGGRALRVTAKGEGEVYAGTPIFMTPGILHAQGYGLQGTPRLHAGQTVRALVRANGAGSRVRLAVEVYDERDHLRKVSAPAVSLAEGEWTKLAWTVPRTDGYPIATLGVVVDGQVSLDIDRVDWNGEPDVVLDRPTPGSTAWRRAWIDAMDQFTEGWGPGWPESYRLIQNEGTGLIIHGPRDWRDVEVTAALTPHMARSTGLAIRVQGLRRHYSFVISDDGAARLIKTVNSTRVVLSEADFTWRLYEERQLRLRAHGNRISAFLDGEMVMEFHDQDSPLETGGVGMLCEEGRVGIRTVSVRPSVT